METSSLPMEPKATQRQELCERHGEFTARFLGRHKPMRKWTGSSLEAPAHDLREQWTECPKCVAEWHAERRRFSDEQSRRDQIERLIEGLKIPRRFAEKVRSRDSFQIDTPEQAAIVKQIDAFIDGMKADRRNGKSLIFIGPVGVGKTHVLWMLLYELASAGIPGLYRTVADLILEVKSSWLPNAYRKEGDLLELYTTVSLLVLDEVGIQLGTDFEKNWLFNVINKRYEAMRPTILSSNLDIKGITEYVGERVIDRLRENDGRVLLFKGQSWRNKTDVATLSPIVEVTQ